MNKYISFLAFPFTSSPPFLLHFHNRLSYHTTVTMSYLLDRCELCAACYVPRGLLFCDQSVSLSGRSVLLQCLSRACLSLCDRTMFLLCEFRLSLTSQEEGEKRKDAGAVMVLARASGDEGLFPCSATNGCSGFRQIT